MTYRGRPADVLVVQHSASDPVSRVGAWLIEAGCRLSVIECHLGQTLPATLAGFDALVVLGGEMGAYDDDLAPWLLTTKELLREAVGGNLPTLGICLGHQLLAVAAGGEVTTAAKPQEGLHDVTLTSAGVGDPLFAGLGGSAAVHWNNDLVTTPPPGAVVLARVHHSVQAVRLGSNVYGVQFHPEVDLATVAQWAFEDVDAHRANIWDVQARLARIAAADARVQETWRDFTGRFAARVVQTGKR